MSFLELFPDEQTLLEACNYGGPGSLLKVNNHIHTPYSFSAFRSIEEAVRMAEREQVRVLGINDFYVTDGYGEFIAECREHGIFPLLNLELIGISRKELENGIRVNDPNNPGRTYLSGKGLSFPSLLTAAQQGKLDRIISESNSQVSEMVRLLNRWLKKQRVGIELSVNEIMEDHSMKLLRERHLAKAMRLKLEEMATSDRAFHDLLFRVYGNRPGEKKRGDIAGVEEELRARLLKSGAPAFVPEDEKAFPDLEEIVEIIRDAGGIPTYPMLLDGTGGKLTESEQGKEQLLHLLQQWGIGSVELIPARNRFGILKEYAGYFYEKGFVVSFGTEHNTTAMGPLTVSCLNHEPLDIDLMEISFNGTAFLAAHQYLSARYGAGYKVRARNEMENLGKAVFQHYFESTNIASNGNR